MTAAPDTLTVLRARGRCLAKRLHPDGTAEAYDDARTFDAYAVTVPDLAAVLALLRRLLPVPECCVIRGAMLAGATVRHTRRLLHPDQATGDAPTVRDVPRRWLALDVEGVARPAAVLAGDLAGCAAAALDRLPPALDGAACIVQASASHGIKPDLRLRLWFILDRPAWGHELKRWFRDGPADPSVFGAVQPVYTAAPILAPGMADPLPARLLLLPGRPVVAVPPPEALAPPRQPERAAAAAVTLPEKAAGYVRQALILAAERIRTAQEGRRHPLIVGETARLARFIDAGLLTESDLAAVVRQAARAAGKDDEGEVSAAIAWGLAHPWTHGPLPGSERNG